MKNEELERKVLLQQNTELVARLQWYRRENQELTMKNQNLNTWVQNLSEVFAAASASWQSITLMEESILALMRKKTDMKDKALLRKYTFHFKTFAGIIDSLGQKIMNEGHSDRSAQEAKGQLDSFVQNYEIFFKEFVDCYFKFNEESSQLLAEMRAKPDASSTLKAISGQALEHKTKIKDFELFMESLKDNFKAFQQHNSSILLAGAIKQKEEEIQNLKDTIFKLERRNKALFDYNNFSVQNELEAQQVECYCGGAQLAYMKKQWEENIKNLGEASSALRHNGEDHQMHEEKKVDGEEYQLLEEEKESLIKRNAILLGNIDKIRVQYKLTDEMVLRSSVFGVLRDQCQYLMDYISDLLGKLKKNQEYLSTIEKNREEEIRDLRKKMEKSKANSNPAMMPSPAQVVPTFKTEALTLIQGLKHAYEAMIKNELKSEQNSAKLRKDIEEVAKMNEDLQRKLNEYLGRELAKTEHLEFRHEKFKTIEAEVGELVCRSAPNLQELWQEFIVYVKNRDKKIRDLESVHRKKDKEIIQKSKILELLQQNLDETEKMYKCNKDKLDQTEHFINRMQKELVALAEENFHKKSEFEQERTLLTLRLKAETEARNKMEEKVGLLTHIDEQIKEMRRNEANIQNNYQEWLENAKQQLRAAQLQSNEKDITVKGLQEQLAEQEKQLGKLQGEKESMKSEIRLLKNKIEALIQKSEDEMARIELREYKGKIMCSCGSEREREVVLKTCPHLFCKKCIDDTQNSRNRKCPLCGIRFTKTDIHQIKWN